MADAPNPHNPVEADPRSDADLLHDYVQQKSEAAFRTLVDRHLQMVYGTCVRKLRDPHWAEDVSQAVFILLAQKAASLKTGPGGVVIGGWLYRTAVFACSNARDLKRTRDFHENRMPAMTNATPTRDGPDPLEQAEVEGLLDEALMALTDAQRETLVLRFFQNKSVAEVAKTRNTTVYAVEKDLAAGLANLRRFLSSKGISVTALALTAVLTAQATAHAAPVTLAAACSTAALGYGAGAAVSAQVAQLVTSLAKTAAFPAKLVAAISIAAGLLLVGTVVIAFHNPFASAPSNTVVTSVAPEPLRAPTPQEEAAIFSLLHRAEHDLRTMDLEALERDVAFTNLRDARNWDAMARVFAADYALKQSAAARFGTNANLSALTAFRTFDQQLDAILPAIDKTSATLRVASDRAVLHFNFLPGKSPSGPTGALYFLRDANGSAWKLDAGKSLEISLEGLDANGIRQPIDRLDDSHQTLTWNQLSHLESTLISIRTRIDKGEFSNPDDLRNAILLAAQQYSGDNHQDGGVPSNVDSGRAFFHLALRRDLPEEAL